MIPEHAAPPHAPMEIVRDGNQIGPDVKFWCHPLGTCTALEAPDESGRFRGIYRQHLANGTAQDVVVRFHVGHVAQ